MKLMKRSGMYKASNVSYNPAAEEARSYEHWVFLKRIDGLLVFNEYPYSPTTQRHQRKVLNIMHTLGIKADMVVSTRLSLSNSDCLSDAMIQAAYKATKSLTEEKYGRPNLDRQLLALHTLQLVERLGNILKVDSSGLLSEGMADAEYNRNSRLAKV